MSKMIPALPIIEEGPPLGPDGKPSPAGKILFFISDYEIEWTPRIVGHDGFFIDEEIQAIGHVDVAGLIPMPKGGLETEAGLFVWEGDVTWDNVASYESGPEYELSLDGGTIRRATAADTDIARNFELPSE